MANVLYQHARDRMLNSLSSLLITNATNATPIVVTTSTNHGLLTGNVVGILGVLGNTAANGTWTVTRTSATAFSLQTSVGNGAYTSATGEVLLTDALLKQYGGVIRWGVGSSGGGNRLYGDDIKCCFLNTSGTGTLYTLNRNSDEFLSVIPAGAIIATSAVMTSKTSTTGSGGTFVGGIADCADFTIEDVGPAATTIEAIAFYKATGVSSESPLIAYFDTATGLVLTANGGDVEVRIGGTATRLFSI